MKSFKHLLSLWSFLVIFSCSKNEELFSCNSIINTWATENRASYENAPRNEIVSLPLELQRSIYASLSPYRKLSLWKQKLALLREDIGEGFTLEEYREVENLINFLIPEHFIHSENGAYISFVSYADEWEKRMRTNFSWDDEKIFYSVGTWMTKSEYSKALFAENRLVTKSTGTGNIGDDEKEDCNCRYTISCGANHICQDSKDYLYCKKVYNCGVAGNSACTGYCD